MTTKSVTTLKEGASREGMPRPKRQTVKQGVDQTHTVREVLNEV